MYLHTIFSDNCAIEHSDPRTLSFTQYTGCPLFKFDDQPTPLKHVGVYDTKIASGAHAVHFLKMGTFFLLEGIFSSPQVHILL